MLFRSTKSLVIVGDGLLTNPGGRPRGAMLRAYDKATGREVGGVLMPAPETGSPMTYLLDGKQYIAFLGGQGAVGGRGGGNRGAAPLEPTAAAANRGNSVPPAPAAQGPNNPRLFVYTVDPAPAAR